MGHRSRTRSQPLLLLIAALALHASPLASAQSPGNEAFEQVARKAAAAREAGKPEEAVRYYRQAVGLRPGWDEGWWYLGSILYDTDHYPEAIPAFKSLIKINPSIGLAWNLLGLSEFETKDYLTALAHLQKGQEIGLADNPEADKVGKYHIALLLIRSGRFGEAEKILSQFAQGVAPAEVPAQIKSALGLSLLRVPLLPAEVDPSFDAAIDAAGETAARLAQGSSQEALDSFQQLLQRYPKLPFARDAYAETLASLGRETEAQSEAGQKSAPVGAEVARAYARSESFTGARAKEAGPAAGSTLALEPGAPSEATFEQLAAAAASARERGRTDDAILSYEAALRLQPDWDEGLRYLGALYYAAGRYDAAIPVAKRLVEKHQEQGSAWALLGLSEFNIKGYDNALLHLQRAYELGVSGGEETVQLTAYHLALLLIRKGEFERAMGLLRQQAGEGSLAERVKIALGLAMLRIPALPEGLDPQRFDLATRAGQTGLYLLESKYDEAFPVFDRLLKDFPQQPYLHYAYASALESLSQYDHAKTQLKLEAEVTPDSPLPYVSLALIDLKLHHVDEALAAGQKAVQLGRENSRAHYTLGRALLEQGNADEAVKELETASRLEPNSPEVHYNLALAYSKAKMPEKAQRERATFTRLSALMDQAKSRTGNQAYGSHERGGLAPSDAPAPGATPQ